MPLGAFISSSQFKAFPLPLSSYKKQKDGKLQTSPTSGASFCATITTRKSKYKPGF